MSNPRSTSTSTATTTPSRIKFKYESSISSGEMTSEMTVAEGVHDNDVDFDEVTLSSLLSCASDATAKLHAEVGAHCFTDLLDISVLRKEVLSEHLQPLIKALQELPVETALPNLQPVEGENDAGVSLGDGRKVYPIHSLILPSVSDTSNVRYLHVHEDPNLFSSGIFIFPPNAVIPLHNHPGMCVLSRIIYGELTLHSYDWLLCCSMNGGANSSSTRSTSACCSDRLQENNSAAPFRRSWFVRAKELLRWGYSSTASTTTSSPNPSSAKGQSLRARKLPSRILKAPDISVLYPYEGNVHKFTAGPNGAAVLDILLPPYDADHDRDCTFFVPEMIVSGEDECYLRPVQQSSDFHCISGVFGEVGMYDE